ncbi:unnamed protein product [Plutella xylostella]|uniref:(diamondback moth) hypothetical protein n=1 Tax=Plutella xylostella TaxID=51655 RepID=A0A8S4FP58_PLUXY|nr:unnamed protein product [Plutella xylostella]
MSNSKSLSSGELKTSNSQIKLGKPSVVVVAGRRDAWPTFVDVERYLIGDRHRFIIGRQHYSDHRQALITHEHWITLQARFLGSGSEPNQSTASASSLTPVIGYPLSTNH